MKFWAGVTDNDWYTFLSARGLDEVNFWRPSPGPYFTGLPAGTPFLFKLKAPNNHIAGGGFFVQYSSLPLEMAWDAFGEKNGMPTFRDFDRKIRDYRKLPKGPLEMGCNVLVQPFFFPRERWIELPTWPKAVVQGKTFDTETTEGAWQSASQNDFWKRARRISRSGKARSPERSRWLRDGRATQHGRERLSRSPKGRSELRSKERGAIAFAGPCRPRPRGRTGG